MHVYWVYDLPTTVFAALVIGLVVAVSLIGLAATRPLARRLFGPAPAYNDIVGDVMQAASAFYGITLGLIAVGAWSASGDAQNKVDMEAAELAALYRDVSCLHDPARSDLQGILRRYTRYVIDEAWPLQRQGKIPHGATPIMDEFMVHLRLFKPEDAADQVFLRQVCDQFNKLYEARRLRIQAVDSGMPAVLWAVVFAGAAITIGLMWCFVMERLRVHAVFTALLSALLALLIFITAAMDNPFRGSFGLGPEAYELTYQQLMKAQ